MKINLFLLLLAQITILINASVTQLCNGPDNLGQHDIYACIQTDEQNSAIPNGSYFLVDTNKDGSFQTAEKYPFTGVKPYSEVLSSKQTIPGFRCTRKCRDSDMPNFCYTAKIDFPYEYFFYRVNTECASSEEGSCPGNCLLNNFAHENKPAFQHVYFISTLPSIENSVINGFFCPDSSNPHISDKMVRINLIGGIECFSLDGVNCLSPNSDGKTCKQNLTDNMMSLNPVKCTEARINSNNHWCSYVKFNESSYDMFQWRCFYNLPGFIIRLNYEFKYECYSKDGKQCEVSPSFIECKLTLEKLKLKYLERLALLKSPSRNLDFEVFGTPVICVRTKEKEIGALLYRLF